MRIPSTAEERVRSFLPCFGSFLSVAAGRLKWLAALALLIPLLAASVPVGAAEIQPHGMPSELPERPSLLAALQPAPPPPNDDFDSAIDLDPLPFFAFLDTSGATQAPDDPALSCGKSAPSAYANSIWYRYSAPADGGITIEVFNADYDVIIAAWIGTRGSLSEVGCNDEEVVEDAYLTIPVFGGETYWVELVSQDPFGGEDINFEVREAFPPVNDDFDSATEIISLPFFEILDTTLATTSADDPAPSCAGPEDPQGSHSVWYRYTPSQQEAIEASLYSYHHLILSVWIGTRGSLVEVDCFDFSETLDTFTLIMAPDTTYWLEISHPTQTAGGLHEFDLYLVPPPPNDDLDNAEPIPGLPFTIGRLDTRGATAASDDPIPSCGAATPPTQSQSVWYAFTPAEASQVMLRSNSSDYDTVVAVWTGTRGALAEVACAHHPGDIDPFLEFPTAAGTTYYVEFAQFGLPEGGNLRAQVREAPQSECVSDLCTFYIQASSNDAGSIPLLPPVDECAFNTAEGNIYLGECRNGDPITSGFRFIGVEIEPGSLVVEAYLEFVQDGLYTDVLDLAIYAEDSSNPEAFSDTNRPDQRTLTASSVSWLIPETEPWSLGQIGRTPDIAPLVQAILDRGDWASGNPLALIVTNAGPASGPNLHRRLLGFDRAILDFDRDQPRLIVRLGVPDPEQSTITVDPPAILADGVDTGLVTVRVLTSTGVPLPNVEVEVQAAPYEGVLLDGAPLGADPVSIGITDEDGDLSATIASTETGAVTLTAFADGMALSGTAQVNFVTRVTDPSLSTLTIDPTTLPADGLTPAVATVTLLDAAGLPVALHEVELGSTGVAVQVTLPDPPTTDVNGVIAGEIRSVEAGLATIRAVDLTTGVTLDQAVDLTFTSGPVDPDLSSVGAVPDSLTADGVEAATITATLLDNQGRILPGHQVQLNVSGTGNTITGANPATSDAAGQAAWTLTSIKAEVKTLIVVDQTDGVTLAQQPQVTFNPGPLDPDTSLVTPAISQAPADGLTEVPIVVTARDGLGNPIPGLTVQISAPGAAVVVQPSEPTNAFGHATGGIAHTAAEEINVSANIDGQPIADQASVTFLGAELSLSKSGLAMSNYDGPSETYALAGGTITYTLAATNSGPLPAEDVVLSDALPTGISFLADLSDYPFTVAGQEVTWEVGPLGESETATVEFEAAIDASLEGVVTNTADVSSSTTEYDVAENEVTLDTIVELPRPAMALSPSGPTVAVIRGEEAQLTATIRNTGGAPMTGIAVAEPPTIPWVAVDTSGVRDLSPREQVDFAIQVAPPVDQTPGYYHDFIIATDDYGNLRRIALTVRVTTPARDLEVTVRNDQGALVPSALLTLVKQEASVIVTEGVIETFHQSAQGMADSAGVVYLSSLEIGDYDYSLSATDHEPKAGVLTVEEGEAAQQVSLSLIAIARMSLSPNTPVIGVLRGDTQGQAITLANLGAAPLTGVAIEPSLIPWVTVVAPSPFPTVPPNQSEIFTIFASPSETQIGDIFQDFVTVTADGGVSAQIALTIELTSEVSRDLEIAVVDSLGNPITGGGSLVLIQQELTTLQLPGGEETTFNQQFKQELDANGRAFFAELEPGEYAYLAQVEGYEQAEGTINVSPGSDVQTETITLIPAPFLYTWEVVPIEQEYEITLTLTYDTQAPAPTVFIEPRRWTFEKCDLRPIFDTIKIHNPTAIRIDAAELQFLVPGVRVEIVGELPESIPPLGHIEVDVVATLEGEPGTGVDLFFYSYDAVPDEIVTYTVNPSSTTSDSIQPGEEYTRDFLLEPVEFVPGQEYVHSIGQFGHLDWISLSVDPAEPQPWETDTQIKLTLTAVAPEFLPEGTYRDEAAISVASLKAYREGVLSVEAIKTAGGLFIHTTFELGEIPYVTKEGLNSGRIVAGLTDCGVPETGDWVWGSFTGGVFGTWFGPIISLPSLPQYIPPPVYGYDHQQVRIEISQRLMLEGEGFSANLTLTNITGSAIQDISVDIRLVDEADQDRTAGFRFEPETITALGDVFAGSSLSQDWFILPEDLGITSSDGENFAVRAIINYTWGGLTYSIETVPELITVYPAPDLVITYELPLPSEPCTIFVLKTTIENRGDGPARNLRLSSSQPEIVDNKSDLIIGFSIVAASVNGEPAPASLDLNLGDLASGRKLEVIWLLGSTLPGRFVEFTSDYRQSNYVGTFLSPLISEINTFFVPGSCQLGFAVPDFATLSSGQWDLCFGETYYATQGYAGGPINTRTGGMDYTYPDLAVPTAAGPLTFRRHYASLATDLYTTELGFGWTHSLDTRLIFPPDPGGEPGQVLFKAHTANLYQFFDNGDGTYSPYSGLCASLTRSEGPPLTYTVIDRSQNTYIFDESGSLSSRSAPNGQRVTYEYGAEGRLIRAQDASGLRFLQLTYDDDGRIRSVTDQIGREVTFAYDPAGDLASATDVLNGTWTYLYDDAHRLTQVIDPRGTTFERTEYDEFGRAIGQYNGESEIIVEIQYGESGSTTIQDAIGNQVVHTYNTRGTLTESQDALDGTTHRVYDDDFRPTSIQDEAGRTTYLSWTENGVNLASVEDPEGSITFLQYDDLNNVTSIIAPSGSQTSFSYDGALVVESADAQGNISTFEYSAEGYLTSFTDPLSRTTTYSHNEFGEIISLTDPKGHITEYRYDDIGLLVEAVDPLGRVTRMDYDDAGRLIQVTRNYDPDLPPNDQGQFNVVTTYAHDEIGNLVQITDAHGHTTQYQYDDANRLILTTDTEGNQTSREYDAAGNLIALTDPLNRTTRYEYDANSQVVAVIDALGNRNEITYNPDGTVASTTDALGRVMQYAYDDAKRAIALVDPEGNTTTSAYDSNGNLIATTDALGRSTTYVYDSLDRLLRRIDPDGEGVEYAYDAVGNRTQTVNRSGFTTGFEYDALNLLISITDAVGNVSEFAHDSLGRRISSTDAAGNVSTLEYDALDRLIEITDPLGNSSFHVYDALGNLISTTDPIGNTYSNSYDALSRLRMQTDPAGAVTSYLYDAVGNRTALTDANGHTTLWNYDELNRLITATDPNGVSQAYEYDPVGNRIAAIDGLGHSTAYVFDSLNRLSRVSDPLGNSTESAFDAVGNRVSITNANGVVTAFEYDALNRVTAAIQNYLPALPPNQETNVRTEYTYDANGNLTGIVNANGHATTFAYDELDRLIHENDALGNTTLYAHDAVGNRTSMTDPANATTAFQYDPLNRLTAIDYPDPDPDVFFTYDALGNRVSMSDGLGSTSWIYDALNRPAASTDPFGDTIEYAYDAVGNRVALTYPDGKIVQYAYEPGNQLARVTDWAARTTSYSYDSANRLSGISQPNGFSSSYSYDAAGRLLALSHSSGPETLSSFEYSYDAVGNRTQAIETVLWPTDPSMAASANPSKALASLPGSKAQVSSRAFDPSLSMLGPVALMLLLPLRRKHRGSRAYLWMTFVALMVGLSMGVAACTFPIPTPTPTPTPSPTWTSTPSPTPTITPSPTATDTPTPSPTPTSPPVSLMTTIDYAYDPLNRLTQADYSSGEFFHYTYDAVGNRLAEDTLGGLKSYQYDPANRLVEANGIPHIWDARGNLLSDGTRSFSYNHANRLVSVTGSGSFFSFVYNGQGDRVSHSVDGVATNYTLDLAAGLAQVLSDGSSTYVYGVGRIGEDGAGGFRIHLEDGLGSLRQLANEAGGITLARSYQPFGEHLLQAGTSTTSYGFAGEQRDDTGLIYLRSRYLNPDHGRFITVDPWFGDTLRPQTFNEYSYVGNNPVTMTDPSGQCYPPLEFLRDIEPGMCATMDQAAFILNAPPGLVTEQERWMARIWITSWATLHAVPVAGGLVVAGEALPPVVTWVQASWPALSWQGQLLAYRLMTSPLLKYLGAAGDAYLILRAIVCGDLDAVGMLQAEWYVTGRLSLQSVLEEGLARLHNYWLRNPKLFPATEAYNARTSSYVTRSVIDDLDPARFDPRSRYGPGLYLSEYAETASLELSNRGDPVAHTIRYYVDLSKATVLDLTDPRIASAMGYTHDVGAKAAHQAIAETAKALGYNVIRFNSFQGPGVNYALLNTKFNPFDFRSWLYAVDVIPPLP